MLPSLSLKLLAPWTPHSSAFLETGTTCTSHSTTPRTWLSVTYTNKRSHKKYLEIIYLDVPMFSKISHNLMWIPPSFFSEPERSQFWLSNKSYCLMNHTQVRITPYPRKPSSPSCFPACTALARGREEKIYKFTKTVIKVLRTSMDEFLVEACSRARETPQQAKALAKSLMT